jgi:hypothetical protein
MIRYHKIKYMIQNNCYNINYILFYLFKILKLTNKLSLIKYKNISSPMKLYRIHLKSYNVKLNKYIYSDI